MLRRDAAPYLIFGAFFVLATLVGLYASVRTADWTFMKYYALIWLLYFPWMFIVSRYRIFWRDGVIIQKASGMADVSIRVEEIARIRQETSNVGTLVRLRRPFRRITIYAEERDGGSKFIDVSLKHFVADDVRKLMRAIHSRRPDLELPKHWV
jgi:hypothetical protein